jgi:hypothetical protein
VNFIGVSSFCLFGLYLLREPATDQHFIAGVRSKEKGRIKIRLYGAMRCPGSDAGRGTLVVPAARAGRAAEFFGIIERCRRAADAEYTKRHQALPQR